MITVARDRCGKGVKERLNDGILTARKILSGLGALAQRLVEESMAVRIVEGVQARGEFRQEAAEIRPPRRRFEGLRQHHFVVVAERLVAGIVQQPQRGGLHGNEVLIVGSSLEQGCALGHRFGSVAHAQVGGA